MAEKLNVQGIRTVRDFLNASAPAVANQLVEKRVTQETILDWQRQAMMVCRIPNLRGHDAQLLVACGVTTPEQLLTANASDLYASVSAFASSKAGQRLLRGAAGADLDEVKHWIAWAQQSRTLRAA
jgi:hypothetical protein